MLKKSLILCLAICMLSISAFAGTQTLSLEGDYTETTGGPVAQAQANTVPDTVYVDTEDDGSQTITLYPAGTTQGGLKTNTNTSGGNFGGDKWFFMKMPLDGMVSVDSFVFNTKMRYNSGATFYVRALDASVWNAAVDSLSNNEKSISMDKAFAVPSGDVLYSEKLGVTSETTYELSSEELTAYIDAAAKAKSEYAYFAVYFHTNTAKNDGCNFIVNYTNADIDGMKPIRGLSASLVGEKTATIYLNNQADIAYVTSENSATNNYSTSETSYKVTTATGGVEDSSVLYFKKDISQYLGKEIISVKFASSSRANSGANKVNISRTENTWIADGEGEISFVNQPAVDESVSELTYSAVNNEIADRSFEIKSLLSGLTSENGVLSLRVRGILGSGKSGYAMQFLEVGNNSGEAPRLIITYRDSYATSETITGDFTYNATIEAEGAIARMIVGIFGENDVFLGAETSEVLTSDGVTPLSLDVALSQYPSAKRIRAYLWNGDTLVPYFNPILRPASVTAAE